MTGISFQQFGRKLDAAATQVQKSEAAIVRAGTAGLASEVASAYRRAAGGDGKLSGTGGARRSSGRQASVGAKAKDVRRYADGNYVGLVVPTGPYGLLERDIAPHVIDVYRMSANRRKRTLRAARKNRGEGQSAVFATRLARAGIDARTSSALRIPGSRTGYAMSANHPGTTGKDVLSSGVRVGGPKVLRSMLQETSKQMLQGYRNGK